MDLRSSLRYSLSRDRGNLSHKLVVLLGVNELLAPGEFELPVLLDERDGEDGFVDELGAVDGRKFICRLRCWGLCQWTT